MVTRGFRIFCWRTPSGYRHYLSTKTRSFLDVTAVNSTAADRVNRAILHHQEEAGCSGSDTPPKEWRMVLPPPNITGRLHLGHALTVTIEDVTWIPGFDHAGIATQAVIQNQLWRLEKRRIADLSPNEFLALCKSWKERRSQEITEQLQRLGATLHWNRAYYTMDENFSHAVTAAFHILHRKGLIFRDRRLVNWCPALRSTISDQEVNLISVDSATNRKFTDTNGLQRDLPLSKMYRIRYWLVETSPKNNTAGFVEVATTRPETVLSDVAIAVNSNDTRYSRLIGQRAHHPLFPQRLLPIIADAAVKSNIGTGALKITPPHDFTDLEIARRHPHEIDLEKALELACIDECGRIKEKYTDFAGLDRFVAREKILERLRSLGAYNGEQNDNPDGILRICSRTGDVIEPMLRMQWFLNCEPLHEQVLASLQRDEIQLTPSFMESPLREWLTSKEPWCLSRQLLWGHRIPAYRSKMARCDNATLSKLMFTALFSDHVDNWIIAGDESTASSILQTDDIHQDSDVLDTWFSSALVPLVVNGWPKQDCSELTKPLLHLMETGHDILGFWVARMLTISQGLCNGLPFHQILLHGIIRDSGGRKMSKSLGNVIDPDDIIRGIPLEAMLKRLKQSALSDAEIARASNDMKARYPDGLKAYGVDALRFALLRHDCRKVDVSLNVIELADEGLRFCYKLHNAIGYAMTVMDRCETSEIKDNIECVTDRWIRSRLNRAYSRIVENLDTFALHHAFAALHSFILEDFCDIYLETTKKALWSNDIQRLSAISAVLRSVLGDTLLLLSMFMPFISDSLYSRLFSGANVYERSLKQYGHCDDPSLEKKMDLALAVINSIRSMKTHFGIDRNEMLHGELLQSNANDIDISDVAMVISDLCNLQLTAESNDNTDGMPLVIPGHADCPEFRSNCLDRLEQREGVAMGRLKTYEERIIKSQEILAINESENNLRPSQIKKHEQTIATTQRLMQDLRTEMEQLTALKERFPLE